MPSIDQLERLETRKDNAIYHHEKLLTAFGGSMDGWEYTGEINDAKGSHCACGHPIRYEYIWTHSDGRVVITGSTCVTNAPYISASQVDRMKEDLEEIKRIAKADKKRAKLAAQNEEVQEQLGKVERLLNGTLYAKLTRANSGVTEYVEYSVYTARYQYRWYKDQIARVKKLKTPRGQLNRLLVIEGWLEGEEK